MLAEIANCSVNGYAVNGPCRIPEANVTRNLPQWHPQLLTLYVVICLDNAYVAPLYLPR